MLSEEDQVSFFTNIRNGNDKAVRDFIDVNKESAPFNNATGESAAAVALKSKQLAVYEALISKGWIFNSNENFHIIVKDLEKVLETEVRDILKQFKENPNKLTSLIDSFLDRNRYISFKNVEKGKLVLKNNIESRIKENIKKIVEQFVFALKEKLRDIHKHFIKNPNEKYLTSLISRSNIYFGGSSAATRERKTYLDLIVGAYDHLNKVPEIRAIFKVVANVKNLNIIFDFDRDSIDHADPTGNENVYGRTYAERGEVLIGAKALNESDLSRLFSEDDDDVKRSEVLGVLAHELCHVAIFRIYNNSYKPYHKDDLENEKEFENVVKHCWKNRFVEEIVALVLNGDQHIMHDELIVRVPHLLALYQDDQDDKKIKLVKETFKMLFDYFEKKTLPDIEKENESMSAVWKLKSKEPQHLTESNTLLKPKIYDLDLVKNKVLEISSNCPQLTMKSIFQETSKPNFNFLFLNLEHLKYEKTNMIDAHSSCMKPTIVINCDNKIVEEIAKIAEDLKKDKITERIIFIHNHKESFIKEATTMTVFHSWVDLMEESKENLMKTMITFQDEEILLTEVVYPHRDALNFIPLKKLLDNKLAIGGNDLTFPEVDIHVERKFQISHDNSEKTELNETEYENRFYQRIRNEIHGIESSQLLDDAKENSKVIILSNDYGMGKTTELKILAKEFKKKLNKFWVTFVDLKKHSKDFEKDENCKTNFISAKEIANFFAKKILKLNEFEEKVFENLFFNNRVVLLLDGFDEISPSYKNFVTMLIRSIKENSTNILIISTRPPLEEDLCKEFNVKVYTLRPLTEENCNEFLEKSFQKYGIEGEDLRNKIDQAKGYLRNFTKNYEPLKNPLILTMVAKVFSKGQFDENKQPNIFSIYENFVFTMANDLMDKGPDAKEELMIYATSENNIYSIHYKEAFNVLFDYEKDFKKRKNIDLCFSDIPSLPDGKISKIGLMKADDSGKIQFIHQTYAEFFVAHFLFKNVFDLKVLKEQKYQINEERMKAVFEILKEVFLCGWFKTVRSFIDAALESFIPNLKVIEKEILFSTFTNFLPKDELLEIFNMFAKESLINIITIITRCADKKEQKRIWDFENSSDTHFETAARWGSLDFNKKFIALAREILDEKDVQKNISKNGHGVIFAASHNNHKVHQFYIGLLSNPNDLYPHRNTIFYSLRYAHASEHGEIFSVFTFLRYRNSWTINNDTYYVYACNLPQYSIVHFKKFWELLRSILGENDFKTILKKPDRNGSTPLMIKAKLKSKEIFTSFWELLTEGITNEEKEKFLIEENKDGDNAFDMVTWNEDPETFLAIKDLYLKTFEKDKMRIMLTRERKSGESILLVPLRFGNGNLETVKSLWIFIQEIFDISTQKTILMKTDDNGKNLYERLKHRQDLDKIFEPFIEEHLTALEKVPFIFVFDKKWLRSYLTKKNKNNESVVSLAFKNNNCDSSPFDQLSDAELYSIIESQVFLFLKREDISALRKELEKIKEVAIGLEYFQNFLKSPAIEGDTIYFEVNTRMSSFEDFQKLQNLIGRILGENDLKTLMNKPGRDGKTLLMLKAWRCKKQDFISFWRFFIENLTAEEKEKYLVEQDEQGKNLFEYATRNRDHETFLVIKDLYLVAFGEEKMKIMLTREKIKNIFFSFIRFGQDNVEETLKHFLSFIQEIFDFSTQELILLTTNEEGHTFYEQLIKKSEEMKIMEKFL